MTKEVMIEALSGHLADEFASARFGSIQKELLVDATEEMQHATTLADQVAFLGGKPSMAADAIAGSDDSAERLRQALAGEQAAAARYKIRSHAAMAMGEHGLVRALQEGGRARAVRTRTLVRSHHALARTETVR